MESKMVANNKINKLTVSVACLLMMGCTSAPKNMDSSEIRKIELIKMDPDGAAYEFIGAVEAEALAGDIGSSTLKARNGIRSKAYDMDANIVVLDSTASENASDLTRQYKVFLTGRAFRLRE